MKKAINSSRRTAIKSSVFGLLTVSLPSIVYSNDILKISRSGDHSSVLFHRYPSIDDEIVNEVVSVSHFNLDRVKELVDPRPELARATWDWSFGDWETALGAASHVGRRDIAEYLMSKGARPDIFTYAMFGDYEVVKSMVEATPGVQSIAGPHGISLLRHARAGARSKELSTQQKSNSVKLIEYLEELGNADIQERDIPISDSDKQKYLGDYMYGDGEKDGLSVKLNMREMLSLGKLGKGGGALFQKAPNLFTYNGITSIEIIFEVVGDKVMSLSIHEPDLILKARKV